MPEAFFNGTEGSGKKLHHFQKTIGANDVLDEIVELGIPYVATYSISFANVSLATANSHPLQIMAGGSLNVYLYSLVAYQMQAATAAAFAELRLLRLTTAGTGGGAAGAVVHDPADAAPGASGMTLPTVKGTEGSVLAVTAGYVTQTPGAAGVQFPPIFQWPPPNVSLATVKPIKIAAGAANGLAFKNVTALANVLVSGSAIIVEANF